MMVKVAWLVRLSQQGDREELRRRWNEDHAALMRDVPGLMRYVHNQAIAIAEGPGAGQDEPSIDGIACAWWSDRDALHAALRSSEWQKVLADGRELFEHGWAHTGEAAEIEERVMRLGAGTPWNGADVAAGMCKHIGVLYFRPGMSRAEARAYWTNRHGQIALKIAEIRHYVQSHAVSPIRLDGEGTGGSFPFDGFSESWFTDRATFERAHDSPAWHTLRDDSPNVFDVDAIEAGVNCVVTERVIKG
jgi:uncharacterized protein (TIGR02118 family)